jgi:hypothetical protein
MRPSCERRTPAPQRQIAAATIVVPHRRSAKTSLRRRIISSRRRRRRHPRAACPAGRPPRPTTKGTSDRTVAHAPAPARAARARQPPLRHAPAASRPASTGSRALTGSLRPLILGSVRTPAACEPAQGDAPDPARQFAPAGRAGRGGQGRPAACHASGRPATPPDGPARIAPGRPGRVNLIQQSRAAGP